MRLFLALFSVLILSVSTVLATGTVDSVFTYKSKINTELQPVNHGKSLLHQYNPVTQLGKYYAHLGNYGLPVQSLLYKAPSSLLTTFTPASMSAYLYTNDSANYYDTKRAYTDIQWINGLKKEQYLHLIHTQNITPRWNVAIDFTRYRNKGYLVRHLANNAHFTASTQYKSKNNKYQLNGAYTLNRISIQENGGINDTVFLNIGFVDKASLPPILTLAARISKSNSFMLNQRYYFVGNKDTAIKKTSVTPPHGLYLNLQNNYSVLRSQYVDNAPATNFYANNNYDTLFTNDSNSVRVHNHLVALGYSSKTHHDTLQRWKYDAYIGGGMQQGIINYYIRRGAIAKPQLFKIQHNTFNNTYLQWQAQASNYKCNITYNGQYNLAGYNGNNVLNNLVANYALTSVHVLSTSINNALRKTDYFNNEYYSNNYTWKNNFASTASTQFNVGYTHTKYRVSLQAFANKIQHYVYFDSLAHPTQSNATILNNGLTLSWHARYKKINWQSNLTLQTNNAPLQFVAPAVLTRQLVYLQGSLFKSALPLQVGFDGSYMSSYKGYGYMPATMQFYNSTTTINPYPFVDFFINASIGQARIFIKAEHFLSGVLGNDYFLAKNSPGHDRAIKVGIYWYMYN
ncbi:MAG: putative porin [Bacteroidia bacterium]